MIRFDNGTILLEKDDPLPDLPTRIERLYLDFETTSRNRSLMSLNPWHNCWIAGVGVTWDSMPDAYYVPSLHWDERWNVSRERVIDWMFALLSISDVWVNHNVKYDYHACANDFGLEFGGKLSCAVVRAKLYHSDLKFAGGYGLDNLSKIWLKEDITQYEKALAPYLHKNKDYGAIPADVMAPYCGQDVLTDRRLDKFLLANIPEETRHTELVEEKFTRVLVKMERRGLRVDPDMLRVERLHVLERLVWLGDSIKAEVGRDVLPTSNTDCFDVLVNQYGLPVIEWTDSGTPSFGKRTLQAYADMVNAPTELINWFIDYREDSTFKGLFLETYEDLCLADGDQHFLHANYNQRVTTGRLSCSDPNEQQLSKRAKRLILPRKGMSFLSADAAGIEFRVIAHYMKNPKLTAAYAADIDADYHQIVADWVSKAFGGPFGRKPAKGLNFQNAFGGGKKACVSALATNREVVGSLINRVDELIAEGKVPPSQRDSVFKILATQTGEKIYNTYHGEFPEIKTVSKQAASICRQQGYVTNWYGVRRTLPLKFAHKAFNSLCQSSAAQFIKEQMVMLDEAYEATNSGIGLVAQVHDDVLSEGPIEVMEDPRTVVDIVSCLEDMGTRRPLRVPIRFKFGTSRQSWYDTTGQDKSVPVEQLNRGERLQHLSKKSSSA